MSRLLLLVCLVLAVKGFDPDCDNRHSRIRRSRNYYGPSQKFFKPPPNSYPIRGPFSYTPPPGYGTDSGPPSYRPKVSKRHNSGIGEEDLHNIVKYLSKQDLDKIFELARKKGRYADDSDDQSFYDSPVNYKESRPIYTDDDDFPNGKMFDGPYDNFRPRPKGFEHEQMPNIYNNKEYLDQPPRGDKYLSQPPLDTIESKPRAKGFKDDPNPNIYNNNEYLDQGPPRGDKYFSQPPLDNIESKPRTKGFKDGSNLNIYNNNEHLHQGPPKSDRFYSQVPLDVNESKLHPNVSPLDEYIHKVIADDLEYTKDNVEVTKTNSEWTSEPMKDYEIAFTSNLPKIVKSESSSYKLENFADLPLMNFDDSRLDTVNSYNVPHFTITSHNQGQNQPLSTTNPFIQQSQSAGKDQSDAHLKAIRIWTHKSKGAAYTLHDDGTLSPERPSRPKF